MDMFLGLAMIVAAVAGFAAHCVLAERLKKVAPEVHLRLGEPSTRTLLCYGRLPHAANAKLRRFVWTRAFLKSDDRLVQLCGWIGLATPFIALIAFAALVFLRWTR